MVVAVEFLSLSEEFQKDPTFQIGRRRKAILDAESLPSIECELFIDLPDDQSRLLDVMNQTKRFAAMSWKGSYSLINTAHIFRVVEL
jgi:hypothetical protein